MNPLLAHEPDILQNGGFLQGVGQTVKYKRGKGDLIVADNGEEAVEERDR
jgi:hypothetical protein